MRLLTFTPSPHLLPHSYAYPFLDTSVPLAILWYIVLMVFIGAIANLLGLG